MDYRERRSRHCRHYWTDYTSEKTGGDGINEPATDYVRHCTHCGDEERRFSCREFKYSRRRHQRTSSKHWRRPLKRIHNIGDNKP